MVQLATSNLAQSRLTSVRSMCFLFYSAITPRNVDGYCSVSEQEIANGVLTVLDAHHKVIEGAAGCAVATLLKVCSRDCLIQSLTLRKALEKAVLQTRLLSLLFVVATLGQRSSITC
jgi:hypothetical protein